MNNELIETMRAQLEIALQSNKYRYQHSLGVAHTSACLAMRYGYDMEKAYIAGLLHDSAKCLDDQKLIDECEKYQLPISEYERLAPYLLHGKLGAYYTEHLYHIVDSEISSAITYHTTGRADMSLLEKILFIADYIEPSRNRAPNLELRRFEAFQDIDLCVFHVIRDTLEYLESRNAPIDPTSRETYEFYKRAE